MVNILLLTITIRVIQIFALISKGHNKENKVYKENFVKLVLTTVHVRVMCLQ